MLILGRKEGESVIIDGEYEVIVMDIRGDRVRLGFNVPDHVAVNRKEIQVMIDRDKEVDAERPESA